MTFKAIYFIENIKKYFMILSYLQSFVLIGVVFVILIFNKTKPEAL